MNLIGSKRQLTWEFIKACARKKVTPLAYLFLNLEHIDPRSRVYSKYALNEKIPAAWKLHTCLLDPSQSVNDHLNVIKKSQINFPLFLKPEWAQSSIGVYRVTDQKMLNEVLEKISHRPVTYICQSAAPGKFEFDLFSITQDTDVSKPLLFSCTKSIAPHPTSFINGFKKGTTYEDKTAKLESHEQQQIYNHIQAIGAFSMTRISVMADNLEAIVNGNFKVIEINLLSPIPLNLFDKNLTEDTKNKYIQIFTETLAISAKHKISKTKNPFRTLLLLHWNKWKSLINIRSI